MNRHLDARLGAGALEHEVEAVLHVKVGKRCSDVVLGAAELLLRRLRLVGRGKTVCLLREALRARKVKARLVNVDRDDASCAVRFGKRAREKADRADTEDEDGPGCAGGESCAT